MNRTHKLSALCLALVAALTLGACDRDPVDDDAIAPPSVTSEPMATGPVDVAPEPFPPAVGEPDAIVTITAVDLGNAVDADNSIAAPMTSFATDDTIHTSVASAGNGGTVSTRWTFQDGQVVHTEDKIVPGGPQVTDFMVTNPQGWPIGSYTVEVIVDGEVVETRQFDVR